MAIELFSNLLAYLSSNDPEKVLQALELISKSGFLLSFLGFDRAGITELINKTKSWLTAPPKSQGCNPECLTLIELLKERIARLENRVFHEEQSNVLEPPLEFMTGVRDKVTSIFGRVIRDKENGHIAKLAIAEARLSGGCVIEPEALRAEDRQRQVFLYLAGDHYANQINTLAIAIHHKFLWRKYFVETRDGHPQATPNVGFIKSGDIIVLAFLNGDSTFRVLVPLLVQPEVDGLVPILNTPQTPILGNSPFRQVAANNVPLVNDLVANQYGPDPRVAAFVGLPVCLINTDFDSELARAIYANPAWPTPGQLAIYHKDGVSPTTNNYFIPRQVREWMATLP